jgi:uncharacterized protein YuzE
MADEESMSSNSQARYDAGADVLYLISQAGEIDRSVEVSPGVTIEYGPSGEVLGLEILHASKVLDDKVVAFLHAKQAGVF